MLVLTRSVGERLIIADGQISIDIIEIKGNQVRIGIHAPKETTIHREEIFKKIQSEKEYERP